MKYNTKPLSGTTELLPPEQVQFDYLYSNITQAFWRAGFQHIVTPVLNRTETLLAKAGGETQQQIYNVFKTGEEAAQSKQALRFDHTVPLARYVAEHSNDLAFPFKVCQIDRNYRGERAQHGRFREFYQCDVDVIGRSKLPIAYDSEIIATLVGALGAILTAPCVVRVSNRKLLTGLLAELNLDNFSDEIFSIIDHAPKSTPEKTQAAFEKLEIGSEYIVKITTFMQLQGAAQDVVAQLRAFQFENELFNEGIAELEQVLQQLAQMSLGEQFEIVADMAIVRGLDYYTGTVFEMFITEHSEYGAICSGGRYDNLASFYTDQVFPGVGGSIGLSRLFATVDHQYLAQPEEILPVDLAIAPISEAEFAPALALATKLRSINLAVDVIFAGKRLGNRLTAATKIAPAAIVIGSDEAASGEFQVKNFATGETTPLSEYLGINI